MAAARGDDRQGPGQEAACAGDDDDVDNGDHDDDGDDDYNDWDDRQGQEPHNIQLVPNIWSTSFHQPVKSPIDSIAAVASIQLVPKYI